MAIGVDIDSPTTVPTTANTAAADNVACPRSQSAAVSSDTITNALTPTKLQQWNAFYQDFIQSHKNYHHNNQKFPISDAVVDDNSVPLMKT